ncbi:MAG: zinc-dependent alcohol dehydrogenase [Anaerolineae bacterium]
MKAVVKYAKGAGKVDLMEMPVPQIGSKEALLKVKVAGICGTDVHIYHDRYNTAVPLVLGHEFVGVVVELGTQVMGWALGERAVVENNPYACGVCRACLRGSPNICPQKRAIGFYSDGCFAEFIRVPANVLHHVPGSLPDKVAALAEPMAVATHATVSRGQISKGERVVVFGPGAVGLLSAAIARARGAEVTVLGIGRDATRLQIAADLGMRAVNTEQDPHWRESLCDADVVIEGSGSRQAIRDGFDLLGRVGRYIAIGIVGGEEVSIPWNLALNKEITLAFCYSSQPQDWEMGLSLMAGGELAVERLATDVLPMAEWRQGLRMAEEGQGIKVLLVP